jgi:NAD(P)H dehydrogenase (quinone)
MMFTLIHHGMLIAGVPYSVPELGSSTRGGTPYGASAVVGPEGNEPPTEMDLKIARAQGKRIAEIAAKLKA